MEINPVNCTYKTEHHSEDFPDDDEDDATHLVRSYLVESKSLESTPLIRNIYFNH